MPKKLKKTKAEIYQEKETKKSIQKFNKLNLSEVTIW